MWSTTESESILRQWGSDEFPVTSLVCEPVITRLVFTMKPVTFQRRDPHSWFYTSLIPWELWLQAHQCAAAVRLVLQTEWTVRVCGVVKPLSCTNSLHAHADLIQIQRHVLTAMRADSPGIVWCSCLRFENNFTLSSENDCRDKQMKSESDVLSLVSEHDSMFSVYLCVETRELGRNQFKNCSVQWRIVWLQWGYCITHTDMCVALLTFL